MIGTCASNGLGVHYTRTGNGSLPIVLLHGLMGSGACWAPVARTLDDDLEIVMPDARGHGGTSKPDHGYRYDELARDVVGLIDHLGLARPIVVGHSMGGMTAAVVARATALRGVVLVDPTFLSPERQREVHASDVADQHRRALSRDRAELVAESRGRHPHRSLEILEVQADARLRTCMAALDVLAPPNPDYREVMAAIEVPILLVIGDTNPVVTLDMAMELRGLNPRVRVEQVEDAGHGLPFDQPQRLGEIVSRFARSCSA